MTSITIGSMVEFQHIVDTKDGYPIAKIVCGRVIDEFREPAEEDRYQRLNYAVRLADGTVCTPTRANARWRSCSNGRSTEDERNDAISAARIAGAL